MNLEKKDIKYRLLNKGMELLNKWLKSPWIKGEETMPNSPVSFLGKIPYRTKFNSRAYCIKWTPPINTMNSTG